MRVVHVELVIANLFVEHHHRHHKPATGHRFSIGAENSEGQLVGVAIVGRPVARLVDQRNIVEVTRLCTDGTKNACSFLYAAAARAAKALGYRSIQTYILDSEPGVTLEAAGWTKGHTTRGGSWSHGSRKGKRRTDQPECPKTLWWKTCNEPTRLPGYCQRFHTGGKNK